jgi:hypothetical protein
MRRPLRLTDRLLARAADALLAWSARRVEPAGRDWIEAVRGELSEVEGGGLALTYTARRSAVNRTWHSWPALLRTSAFGLALSAVLMGGVVWSNVVVPSHESDDEYGVWYLVFYVGLLVYFFVAGLVVAGRPASVVRGAVTGAVTALLVALLTLVTFAVIDNLFLDVVMQQPDKAYSFAHSGMTSQRDFVNSGLVQGLVFVPLVLGGFGAAFGALGGAVRGSLERRGPGPAPAPN